MKKAILSVCVLAAMFVAAAAQRVVVAEHATQWNCPYCPGPNAAVDELLLKYPGNLAVVRYHGWWPGANNDPFYLANTTENAARINYYGIPSYGVPAHVVDGKKGDYQVSEARITAALAVTSPIELSMTVTYDTLARTGAINWKAKAVSTVSLTNLRLRCAITESEIYATGGSNGETWFNQVMRDMLPDATGEALTLVNAGDSAIGTKNFAIDGTWAAKNCEIIIWVQTDNVSGDQWRILEGAKKCLGAKLLQKSVSAGTKASFQFLPGETAYLTVCVQNHGGRGLDALCQISEDSPYLEITNGTWNIGTMELGDTASNATTPFSFTIDPATPNGHRTPVLITKSITNEITGYQRTVTDTAWIIVGTTTQLFYDDFENGYANWYRSGTSVKWDTTSLQSHSPTHCITDSRAGNYANNANLYIQLNSGINLTAYPAALLSWWERYSTEEGYDFCIPMVSPNSSTWYSPIPQYSGSSTTWNKRTVDITPYLGSAFNVRFRLSSDGGVVDDGWYVDDVMIEVYENTGVTGGPYPGPLARTCLLPANPNPSFGSVRISYQLAATGVVSLNVYDIAGKLVRTVESGIKAAGSHLTTWDGRDQGGRQVANGVYLYRLTAGDYTATRKLTIVR